MNHKYLLMKKIFVMIPLLGLLLACNSNAKQADDVEETLTAAEIEAVEALETASESLEKTMKAAEEELQQLEEDIDNLLNDI